MALDPSLERPRQPLDPNDAAFSDAVTCAFSDARAGVHGTVRIGIAGGSASGPVTVFADGAPALSHAEGGVALDRAPESYAEVRAAGIEHAVVEPHVAWTVTAATESGALDLQFRAVGPPLVMTGGHPVGQLGGTEGYEQPCRVTGTVRLGDRQVAIDGLGQRGHQWGSPDWSQITASRTITGWFGDGPAFAVTSLRPTGARSHADEVAWAAIARVPPPEEADVETVGPLPVAETVEAPEPRISTTTDADGRHPRATVELWESDHGPVWTATGEAVAGNTMELGRLRLDTAFYRWRLNGLEGVGRYDILRKV